MAAILPRLLVGFVLLPAGDTWLDSHQDRSGTPRITRMNTDVGVEFRSDSIRVHPRDSWFFTSILDANHFATAGVESSSETTDVPSLDSDSTSDDEAEAVDRAKVVEVGVWVLLGVVLLAGVVVTTLLMYGAHARRVARAPMPERTRDDAFWYLRKPKAEIDAPASESTELENEPDPEP